MSGYGFSVGSSGYDDKDRLVTSGIGILPVIPNRTHGPTHELLTVASRSVTHDAKGNMTSIPAVLRPANSGLPPTASRLTWDFENKLIAADPDNDSVDDIFYKFDTLCRRVGRDDGTANVVYFQDGQQTIADCPSGTSACSPTYTYVYASYIDEPVMRGGSGGLRYYHRNQQYSITAISDGGGTVVERYAYSAYGQVTIADASGSVVSDSAIANRYTYTGREWDEGLSLYHYRARLYDAVAGRFVSRDTIGYVDGASLYRNFFGTSLNDPTGLSIDWPACVTPPPPNATADELIKHIELKKKKILTEINRLELEIREEKKKRPNDLKKIKALQAIAEHLRPGIKYLDQANTRIKIEIRNGEARGGGGSRGGGRLRCIGPIALLIDAYSIVVDPWGYWEEETKPLEERPPVIWMPMGPVINTQSGQGEYPYTRPSL